MKFLLTFLTFLIGLSVHAQSIDRWASFQDKNSELIGFKDASGYVKIEPRFSGRVIAEYFENIVAVTEEKNGKYQSYYLTRTGKKIGRDSLYYFDNTPDCESEGFIRFRDKVTDKVGLFDKNGKIVIPALYNALSRVQNGHVWALKGAQRKYLDKHKEHYSWEGGEEMLINTNNEVVIKDSKHEGYLNLYSLKTNPKPTYEPESKTFKGVNGSFYAFIEYEKEFKTWLDSNLLNHLTLENLAVASFDSITYWQEPNGWTAEAKGNFLSRNLELIKKKLSTLKEKKPDFTVFINGLNHFIYQGDSFAKYYNNCGEANQEKYPVVELVLNSKAGNEIIQDHFEFLRTEAGYKLLSITIRNGELK